MKNARKKSIAVLAGLSVAGLVGASAATLGNVTSNNLGAGLGEILSCDSNGVSVSYDTGYAVAQGIAVVDSVTISEVNELCDGQIAEVTLIGADDVALGTATQTLDLLGTTSFDVAFSPRPSAEDAVGIAITISGVPVP